MSRNDDLLNEYDPLAPEEFGDVYRVFADLRQRCPVPHSAAFGGFWSLLRHADVAEALHDSGNFITSVANVVPGSATTRRRPPLHLDPPEHTPYRAAIDRALGSRRVAAIEPAARRHARELAAALLAKGGGDLVAEFASPLPALVFGEWMGLEAADTRLLWNTAQTYVQAFESFDKEAVAVASERLTGLAKTVIADRRARPRDPEIDPTSSLLAARDAAGQPLPDDLLTGCVRQVLVVGLVAPPIVVGSIVVHLSRDQDLQTRLRDTPALLAPALEEFLRLYTPYRGFARTRRTTAEFCGRTIEPNEPIALNYASANRDEAVFPDPDEFRLDRVNIGQHLAFGRGPHRCAGMPLARLELKVAIEALLEMTSRIDVVGPVRMSRMPEVGPTSVPVRMTPR